MAKEIDSDTPTNIPMPIEVKSHPDTDPADEVFSDTTFSLDDFVGRGELGIVYKGMAWLTSREDDKRISVVVKKPHSRAKAEEALLEYRVLTAMRHRLDSEWRSGTLPIPEVSLGVVEPDNLPVMVMPYYQAQNLLITRVRHAFSEGLMAERVAVLAGIQFARAMQALHSLEEPVCCTDRKIKDFYVLDDTHVPDAAPRIVIIDWNVLRKFTPEFRLGEIRLFGYLWHELFMERKGEPPFEPFSDARWQPTARGTGKILEQGVLSIGLRMLLARAVNFQPERDAVYGEDYFAALEQALTAWAQIIDADNSYSSEMDVRNALSLFPSRQPNPAAAVEIDAALVDIRWRLSDDTARERDIAQRAQALLKARQATGSGDVLQQEIAEAFERDPAGAQVIVTREKIKAESQPDWVMLAHLERWQRLIDLSTRADALNRAGSIRGRDKIDIERRAVGIGRALHVRPADESRAEIELAQQAAGEIRAFHADLNTPGLRQIETEIRLRRFNHDDRTDSLIEYFHTIQTDLQAAKQPEHYLSNPPGYQLGDTILIGQIVDHHLVADFLAAFNNLSEDVDTEYLYRLYQTALAAADIQYEGRTMAVELQPVLEIWEFVVDCRTADLSKKSLHDLFSRAQILYNRYNNDPAPPVEEWETLVAAALKPLAGESINLLRGALVSASLESVMHVGQIYLALNNYYGLLEQYSIRLDRDSFEQYKDIYNFCNDWLTALNDFRPDPTPDKLRHLLQTLDSYDPAKVRIPMSDLLGSTLIQKYRRNLETVLEQGLDENLDIFIRQANDFKHSIDSTQHEVQDQISGLSNEVSNYLRTVKSLIDDVNNELVVLQEQQLELQARQALESFDVDALSAYLNQRPTRSALNDDLNALKELEYRPNISGALNTLSREIGLKGSSNLDMLRDLRDKLRERQMVNIDSHGVEQFFVDHNIVGTARHNHILQSILDLYWVMRANQLRAGREESLSDIMANLTARANETRRQLNELSPLFDEGKNDRVRAILKNLSSYPQTLTDELLRQLVYGWQERLAANEVAHLRLQRLNSKLADVQNLPAKEASEFETRLEKINNLLRDAQKIVTECPHSAYTQNLHTKWTDTSQQFKFEIKNLADYINQMRGGKHKEDLLQRHNNLVKNWGSLMREAEEKVKQHHNIFAVSTEENRR